MADQKNVDIEESNSSKAAKQSFDSSSVGSGDACDESYGNSGSGSSPRRKSQRSIGNIILRVVLIVIIVVVVVCVGGFSIYRWLWGNDVLDIQGTWYIEGSDTPIVVTEDHIVLNDEVSYFYEINTESKTITYTLGDLSGSGYYRFSVDRNQIAIMDGTFNWWTTLISDVPWTADALVSFIGGEVKSPAGENNVTLLSRNGFSMPALDSSNGDNSDVQSEKPEETGTSESEDTENVSDLDGATDQGNDDFSDSSQDQNDQTDQETQDDKSDTDSSNGEDNRDAFDMFGMYDI